MPLGINTNLAANGVLASLDNNQRVFDTEVHRLSTGLRINSAADDPAGLVISEKYRAQVNGLGQAIQNAKDGVNLVQTAEGALQQVSAELQSIRTLILHAANDGVNDSSAAAADQQQISAALDTINNIADNTQFGTKRLLDGTFSNKVFQIGAYASQTTSLTINDMHADQLGLGISLVHDLSRVDVTNSGALPFANQIEVVDKAIDDVTTQRASLGSFQKDTLEATVANEQVAQQNMTQTESSITDANMAQETLRFSRAQILQQTGLAMLAQANQQPSQLLVLFR